MYVYRWDMMRELLERHKDWDGDPYEALMVEYVDPTSGGPVFKTITFFVQMLRPGEKTQPLRQTASLLVAPFEGTGYSLVDGKRFDWKQFDTLAVPGGAWCEHVNALRQGAGVAVRRERRAGAAGVLAVQEMGPRGQRRRRAPRLSRPRPHPASTH